MHTEIEAKFPDIHADALRASLKKAGAVLEQKETLMRRRVYDFPSASLYAQKAWVRVRDEGNQITMSYKQMNDRSLHGTKEINLIINDFDEGDAFLSALGLESKSYQETRRESWLCGGVEVTIDTWPWIPTFVELEGPSEDAVKACAAQLGLDWKEAMHGSVETVYQMHYDVTEKEIDGWETITFVPVPAWLEAKRKK